MADRLLIFFICLVTGFAGYAQVRPAPGAEISYTQVMFEYGKVSGAGIYLVQLVVDTPGSSFDHPLVEQRDSATATMISGLEFGKKYKWRYAGITDGAPPVWHGPWYFSIVTDTLVRMGIVDLSVTTDNTPGHAGGLIINDATHTITDREGRMVWCLPKVKWKFYPARLIAIAANGRDSLHKVDIRPYVFDMRLTPYGTVSYLTDSSLVECDLDGRVLWQKHDCTPLSEIGEDNYNHVFLHLPDGHYMTLGKEVWRRVPPHSDNSVCTNYLRKRTVDGVEYARVDFGTVIEYDKKGNVAWSWNSEDYFDRYAHADPEYNMDLNAHVNALSIDRSGRFVYVGFRDNSRIVKVEKSSGKVVDSWGPASPWGVPPMHSLDIHKQHDAAIQDDGTVMVFNNNDYLRGDSSPSVIIFSQAAADNGSIIWKYNYRLDPDHRRLSRTGGNVDRLPNGNILVCTGTVNTIFEVTPDKKIVWQAMIMPRETPGYNYSYRLYRAHYVSSLYPCYFAFVTDRDTVPRASPQFNVRIFNRGSEEDTYDVQMVSPSGEVGGRFVTHTLAPGSSATIRISPNAPMVKGDKMEVRVSSKTNPDLERRCWVWYAR